MQVLANTLVAACAIALSAMSFRLVYVTGRFFHFAHAAMITLGPYLAYVVIEDFGLPVIPGAVLAVLLTAVAGGALFLVFLRPLVVRGSTPLVLLLASMALQLIVQHSLVLVFGEDARALVNTDAVTVHAFGGVRITEAQLALVAVTAAVTLGLLVMMRLTAFGRQQSAVAEHQELSTVFGIPVLRVQLNAFLLGSGVAGMLGILVGADFSFSPDMGFYWLLPGVVAVIVGGVYDVRWVLVACLGVAATRTAATWFLGAAWENQFVYALLFAYFLLRPHGLGSPAGRAEEPVAG